MPCVKKEVYLREQFCKVNKLRRVWWSHLHEDSFNGLVWIYLAVQPYSASQKSLALINIYDFSYPHVRNVGGCPGQALTLPLCYAPYLQLERWGLSHILQHEQRSCSFLSPWVFQFSSTSKAETHNGFHNELCTKQELSNESQDPVLNEVVHICQSSCNSPWSNSAVPLAKSFYIPQKVPIKNVRRSFLSVTRRTYNKLACVVADAPFLLIVRTSTIKGGVIPTASSFFSRQKDATHGRIIKTRRQHVVRPPSSTMQSIRLACAETIFSRKDFYDISTSRNMSSPLTSLPCSSLPRCQNPAKLWRVQGANWRGWVRWEQSPRGRWLLYIIHPDRKAARCAANCAWKII